MDNMEKVKNRALEIGVYLPLGAYSKIRESVGDIDADRLKKRYQDFVRRGEDRIRPAGRKVTMPRVAAPADAKRLPISGYDQLTVGEIRARLNGLTQTDLAKVFKYERSNQNRSSVLESIEAKFVELPMPTYDALTADEIGSRLDGLTEQELSSLRRYEADTKARTTILDRMDAKLA